MTKSPNTTTTQQKAALSPLMVVVPLSGGRILRLDSNENKMLLNEIVLTQRRGVSHESYCYWPSEAALSRKHLSDLQMVDLNDELSSTPSDDSSSSSSDKSLSSTCCRKQERSMPSKQKSMSSLFHMMGLDFSSHGSSGGTSW